MAEEKLYIGTHGPIIWDTTDAVDDPDGDFAGLDYNGFMTTGQVYVEGTPTLPFHVARQVDLTELEAQLESSSYFFARIY